MQMPSTQKSTGFLSIPIPPEVLKTYAHAMTGLMVAPYEAVTVEVRLVITNIISQAKPIRRPEKTTMLSTTHQLARRTPVFIINNIKS